MTILKNNAKNFLFSLFAVILLWDCAYTQLRFMRVYINFVEWFLCTQTSTNSIICLFLLFCIPFMLLDAFVPKIHRLRCRRSPRWMIVLCLLRVSYHSLLSVFTHMQRFVLWFAQLCNRFIITFCTAARFAPDLILNPIAQSVFRCLFVNAAGEFGSLCVFKTSMNWQAIVYVCWHFFFWIKTLS